jgi:two-component system phosphate regulon sensor histidine kinase PhoR
MSAAKAGRAAAFDAAAPHGRRRRLNSLSGRIFLVVFLVMAAVELLIMASASAALTDAARSNTRRDLADMTRLAAGVLTSPEASPAETLGAIQAGGLRVTLVGADGDVLADSAASSENHADRPEIIAALATGEGTAERMSDTLGEVTLYHALRLNDGTVLRLATTRSNALASVSGLLLPGLALFALLTGAALVAARRIASYLTAPLLSLDLDRPLENEAYEELQPLLARMDEQRLRIAASADEMSLARREFTANVSHELKTPLTVISGYAELMKDSLVKAEDVPYFSELIHVESRHMRNLVEDILILSQLDETGHYSIDRARVDNIDLRAIASDVIDRLMPFAEQHNVSFSLESEGDTVMAGIARVLSSMAYNLCENAIRYNNEGGSVRVRVSGDNSGVALEVSDTGIGIDPEDQERIFERFYRADKTRSRKSGGTGLGLAIVKHGAARHGASIALTSAPGEGTAIRIFFPKDTGR